MNVPSAPVRRSPGVRVAPTAIVAAFALVVVLTLASAVSARSTVGGRTQAVRTARTSARIVTLTTARSAQWAPVVNQVVARRAPSRSAAAVATVATVTGDGTQNILLLLNSEAVTRTQTWYKVRLAILPNNSVGWIPASALGTIYTVNTHLYIDQKTLTATLMRNGVAIFTTRVGVGEPYWPTPAGQFYIRDKLTNFDNPFYGPVAFGTSARSAVLTEWPGGGFVGVHGTNEPNIIPGRISHGCIRMVNSAIERLAKLMPVGTPVTVTAP